MDTHRACIEHGYCRPRHRAKKDRKHWCGGKAGVEHHWEWRRPTDVPNAYSGRHAVRPSERPAFWEQYTAHVEYCAGCGRTRDYRYTCHCGVIMVSLPGRGRWRFGDYRCPSCGFFNNRVYTYLGAKTALKIIPGRPVHTCEPRHLQRLQEEANAQDRRRQPAV